MDAGTILLIVAGAFAAFTLLDWRRYGGTLTPKRRTWLIVAGIFLAVSLYLRLG
jgi:hypothetical protein